MDEPRPNAPWCLVVFAGGADVNFCEGLVFEDQDEAGCEYEIKRVKRGGITCEGCLRQIREIKAIRL